jgi:aspartyl protease family protein
MYSLKQLLLVALLSCSLVAQAADVEIKGLFKGSAIVVINGKQKLLKAGQSFSGVTLISSSSKAAVVEIDGQRHKLGMSRKISSTYKAAEKVEVRLAQVRGGHYITKGRINNRAVTMMVDTGATSVAMSLPQAKALGLDYRNGTPIRINTANGVSQGYKVMLRSVQVGAVRVDNVEAVVNMSDFPDIILLGNSYLSRVSMNKQNGVLILQSKL